MPQFRWFLEGLKLLLKLLGSRGNVDVFEKRCVEGTHYEHYERDYTEFRGTL